jgi:hypothetical protein
MHTLVLFEFVCLSSYSNYQIGDNIKNTKLQIGLLNCR